MKIETLAYSGGALDSDGTVGYIRQYRKDGSLIFSPKIHITQSVSYPYICHLQQALDFETSIHRVKSEGPNKRETWRLYLSAKEANTIRFIDMVSPFVKLKGERLLRLKDAILGIDVEENLKKITELNRLHGHGKKINSSKRKMLTRKPKRVKHVQLRLPNFL